VLKDAETNEVFGKMKFLRFWRHCPKSAGQGAGIMTELEIAPTRRLRGLGDRQRKALLEKFDFTKRLVRAAEGSTAMSARAKSRVWR